MRVVVSLLWPLARAVDWLPVALAVPAGLALVSLVSPGKDLDPVNASLVLRAVALLMASAGGFALVDAMGRSTGALPVPRWARQWARTGMVLAALAAGWGAMIAVAVARSPDGVRLPVGGLSLEAAVCALTGLAAAGLAVR
ncbi:hypothetical protein, partial [Spongiactinospora sp. TRM90649]|uniref:hypothetical protein n=1 Tax=Spongiactinospora sp. TRM90649 TaxID=3031114 RepID=UPI0023F971BE